MAKLTLSMINYRIAQSLLSLNLTIGEEPIDSNLFSRVHASKMQVAEQNNAAGQAAVVPPSANSTAKVPNTSGSKRGQEHQSKNSHKGHPQSISAKRSLSATFDEVVREDHPQKRQRAQSAEEEGIVSEKSAIGKCEPFLREFTRLHFLCIVSRQILCVMVDSPPWVLQRTFPTCLLS